MSLYELQNVANVGSGSIGSGDASLFKESDRVCEVCYKGKGVYSCPKCHLRYCALSCYRDMKHMRCYEDFYKDLVHEELGRREVSRDEREEILAMVERAQHQTPTNQDGDIANLNILADQNGVNSSYGTESMDGDSDDDATAIMERLAGIDLDDDEAAEAIWQSFTAKEKKDFEASIADGRMGNMLTLWVAWWDMEEPNIYVPDCIPEFCALSRSRPATSRVRAPGSATHIGKRPQHSQLAQASALQYNLLDMVLALVYTLRSFNGDLSSTRAYMCLLEMCAVLSDSAVHESASQAVQSFLQRATDRLACRSTPTWDAARVLGDVETLLRLSHECLVVALADLHFWLVMYDPAQDSEVADPQYTIETHSNHDDRKRKARKRQHANHARKAWFYLAWINDPLAGGSTTRRQNIAACTQVVKDERSHLEALQSEVAGVDAARFKDGSTSLVCLEGNGGLREHRAQQGNTVHLNSNPARTSREKVQTSAGHSRLASAAEGRHLAKPRYFDTRSELRADDAVDGGESLTTQSTSDIDSEVTGKDTITPTVGRNQPSQPQIEDGSRNVRRPMIVELDEDHSEAVGLDRRNTSGDTAVNPMMAELGDKNRTRSAFAKRREEREERAWKEGRRKALPKLTEISARMMGIR
ncbi:hypothetical protein SARC_01798 [Sphaeroforma arctica JP610]|uniref:HIT-type domain-containing protein n=1 Tax=Sphaeroforma arctica JP610 TaxID=667725 RepID=A0A0L0GAU5_9EUKA|nr:hypothetical protein SARC_01798 [Sphaeroforma arctica JP610]KNC86039.1 hypothetical protein SARC_01798 [Sphaeroforma arctica JP610]|eukprot:XP_014159941.1 hypothetical protein SARC_01798 [Sphaeroforma arctica JP610]